LGIGVASTTGALLAGNKATNNGGSGIDISLNSDANRVVGNTVTGNRNFDLADNNLPACVNTWQGNAFVTDNEGNGPGAGCIR
jgi:parallel beta-helix repeat protein